MLDHLQLCDTPISCQWQRGVLSLFISPTTESGEKWVWGGCWNLINWLGFATYHKTPNTNTTLDTLHNFCKNGCLGSVTNPFKIVKFNNLYNSCALRQTFVRRRVEEHFRIKGMMGIIDKVVVDLKYIPFFISFLFRGFIMSGSYHTDSNGLGHPREPMCTKPGNERNGFLSFLSMSSLELLTISFISLKVWALSIYSFLLFLSFLSFLWGCGGPQFFHFFHFFENVGALNSFNSFISFISLKCSTSFLLFLLFLWKCESPQFIDFFQFFHFFESVAPHFFHFFHFFWKCGGPQFFHFFHFFESVAPHFFHFFEMWGPSILSFLSFLWKCCASFHSFHSFLWGCRDPQFFHFFESVVPHFFHFFEGAGTERML